MEERQRIFKEDSLEFTHQLMMEIKEAKEEDIAKKQMNMATRLKLRYFVEVFFGTKYREEMGDQLAADDAGKICTEYMDILTQVLDESEEQNSPTIKHNSICLSIIRLVCINFSDASSQFAAELGSVGMFSFLSADLKKFKDKLDDEEIYFIINRSLAILHNCAKQSVKRRVFENAGAVQAILPYTKADCRERCRNFKIKMLAILTLAYISNDEENKKFSADGNILDYMLECLKDAVKNSDHRCGFSATEIVYGIWHLASNDDNKIELVKRGILPLLEQLLDQGDMKAKKCCTDVIYRLTFVNENKEKISGENNLMELLEKLSEQEGQASSSAAGALRALKKNEQREKSPSVTTINVVNNINAQVISNLAVAVPTGNATAGAGEGNVPRRDASPSGNVKGHIMISYRRTKRDLVLPIAEKLKMMDYKVWIDVQDIKGDIYEAMAVAVKNSEVFLMCYSEDYMSSDYCRGEAEYAATLGKHIIPIKLESGYEPDGWLGFFVSPRIYYDFSDKAEFMDSFLKLLKELGNKGKY